MIQEQMYITMAKVLNGETSADEKQEFEAWLSSDPTHQQAFDEMKLAWRDADLLLAHPTFNTEAAWDKVSLKMQDSVTAAKPRVIAFPNWQKYMLAAAAMLVIGLVSFWNILNSGNIIVTASAGNQEVVLPDNSYVTLREGSSLEYPRKFSSQSRRSVVLSGEAFFDVARNEEKPFVIDAGAATVKVLGTSFNVNSNDEIVTVTVATGKVEVRSNQRQNLSVILNPGEKAIMGQGEVEKQTETSTNYLYWKTGALSYTNAPLSEVVNDMSEQAGLNIQFQPATTEDFKGQAVTISFKTQTIEEMLSELCLITDCKWIKQGDTYFISGRN